MAKRQKALLKRDYISDEAKHSNKIQVKHRGGFGRPAAGPQAINSTEYKGIK